jgi:hypothetical protein
MAPIRQGSRLTLRNALYVIFSRELPRSLMTRMPLWALLNCCCRALREPCFGFLERHGDGVGLAFVAEVAEGT